MSIFDKFRDNRTHEDRLREEAGLEQPALETARTFGTRVVDVVNSTPDEVVDIIENEDDDPEFEAEVAERVAEIEAMSVPELLKDAADDMARAELGDEEDEQYFMARSNAAHSRAVALLLQQLIEKDTPLS